MEFTRLSAGYLFSNWDLVWLCCWQGLTTFICCASSLLGTAMHTHQRLLRGVWCLTAWTLCLSSFSKVFLFSALNIQTHWSMQQGHVFMVNPTNVTFLENTSFGSVCFSLIIITTAVVAEPKQSILVQHRKTWVCMIVEGSLSFILLKLYCMLQCNQQPSPGAVFEVSTLVWTQ